MNWSGNTGGVTDVTQPAVSVVMDSDRTITVNFALSSTTYRITAASVPLGGGSVNLSPVQELYYVTETVSVSCTPAEGYTFSHWTGDAAGSDSFATLRVDSDKSVTAVFNPTLSIRMAVEGGGTVDASPAITSNGYLVGTAVGLTARPAIGYLFRGWTGDVSGIPDVREAPVTVVMDAPRTLMANFVSSPPLRLTTAAQDEASGAITLEPVQPAEGYLASSEVKAYALPKAGYAFSHWTGDATGTSPVVSLTMDGEKSMVAVFDPKVAIQTDAAQRGSIEITPPALSGGYPTGTEVTVEAAPGEGYRFKSWGGDLSGSENPTSIVVESPMTVSATFVKAPRFPWWWVVLGVVALFAVLIGWRLAYVLARQRSDAE